MIRLLYFSTARAAVSREDVDALVAAAAKKNAMHEITGALAYNGRNFCQVLEGEAEAVNALMEQIAADPRHSGVKVLDTKEVDDRHFESWSMKLVKNLEFSVVINAMTQ